MWTENSPWAKIDIQRAKALCKHPTAYWEVAQKLELPIITKRIIYLGQALRLWYLGVLFSFFRAQTWARGLTHDRQPLYHQLLAFL